MLVAEEAVEIRVLSRQGKSIREIARMLEVSRNTVRRYLRTEGLPRYQREARGSKLDAYKPASRWQDRKALGRRLEEGRLLCFALRNVATFERAFRSIALALDNRQ